MVAAVTSKLESAIASKMGRKGAASRWRDKSPEEKRAHALAMVAARRKKQAAALEALAAQAAPEAVEEVAAAPEQGLTVKERFEQLVHKKTGGKP